MDEYMTLDELAKLVRREPKTVTNWRSARKPGMPVGIRPAGSRTVLFRRTDVVAWLEGEFADEKAKRAS